MSHWKHWACDVSMVPPCFVPVEFDAAGEIESFVFGLNLVSDRCPGELVCVIHEDGQEAVEAWLANPENHAWLEAAAARPPQGEDQQKGERK
jgi:hypothetical protein